MQLMDKWEIDKIPVWQMKLKRREITHEITGKNG
jgi:hypothetical protein